MILEAARQVEIERLGVAFFDYEYPQQWEYQADDWFHAASTIKVVVLLAVFAAMEEGRFRLDSRLHVRNRFLSVFSDEPYRIDPARDSCAEVHAAIGKTMRIGELAQRAKGK